MNKKKEFKKLYDLMHDVYNYSPDVLTVICSFVSIDVIEGILLDLTEYVETKERGMLKKIIIDICSVALINIALKCKVTGENPENVLEEELIDLIIDVFEPHEYEKVIDKIGREVLKNINVAMALYKEKAGKIGAK